MTLNDFQTQLSAKKLLHILSIPIATVLLTPQWVDAGQCVNGKNYNPSTGARQPSYDYLCQGYNALADEFQKQMLGGMLDDWTEKNKVGGNDWDLAELYRLRAEKNQILSEIARKKAERQRLLANTESNHQKRREIKSKLMEEQAKLEKLESKTSTLESFKKATEETFKEYLLDDKDVPEYIEIKYATYETSHEVYQEKTVAQKKVVERLQKQMDNYYAQAEMSRDKAKSIDAEITSLKAKLPALEAAIAKENQKVTAMRSGEHQSSDGLPPDATVYDYLGKTTYWINTNISHLEDDDPTQLSDTDSRTFMVGANLALDSLSGIGIGLGIVSSETEQAGAFGGVTESDGVNLALNGYWGSSEKYIFDGSLAYGISENTRTIAANSFKDSYDVETKGFGIGVSTFEYLSSTLRLDGRLGWAISETTRKSSTDSGNVTHSEDRTVLSQANLKGRLSKPYESIRGTAYVETVLSGVTSDGSGADRTDHPLEAELAVGFKSRIDTRFVVSGRGFLSSIGQEERKSYGASVNLDISY